MVRRKDVRYSDALRYYVVDEGSIRTYIGQNRIGFNSGQSGESSSVLLHLYLVWEL